MSNPIPHLFYIVFRASHCFVTGKSMEMGQFSNYRKIKALTAWYVKSITSTELRERPPDRLTWEIPPTVLGGDKQTPAAESSSSRPGTMYKSRRGRSQTRTGRYLAGRIRSGRCLSALRRYRKRSERLSRHRCSSRGCLVTVFKGWLHCSCYYWNKWNWRRGLDSVCCWCLIPRGQVRLAPPPPSEIGQWPGTSEANKSFGGRSTLETGDNPYAKCKCRTCFWCRYPNA